MLCSAEQGQTGLGKNFSQSQFEPSVMAQLQGDVHERAYRDCAPVLISGGGILSLEKTGNRFRQKMHLV